MTNDRIDERVLGRLPTSTIGLGCMSMSSAYGTAHEGDAIATIRRALDLGVSLLDTSDLYGDGHNEELVGRAIAGRRSEVTLSSKFGLTRQTEPDGSRSVVVDARPERARPCCEASLRRLGVDVIDLYFLHRVDPAVPVEETVGAMADLVEAGLVRFLGLSEAGAGDLRRGHVTHRLDVIQSEWSLWSRAIEDDVVPTCRELGIGIMPYSPLGKGLLAGAVASVDDLEAHDVRRHHRHFQPDQFPHNVAVADRLAVIGRRLGCSPAQLALAWLLAQGGDVVPIPGTRTARRLEENAAARNVRLSTADREDIELAATVDRPTGDASVAQRWKPGSARTRVDGSSK
jgi:aryl-alcohol dehydrogenase-like predicted oxidoreductase